MQRKSQSRLQIGINLNGFNILSFASSRVGKEEAKDICQDAVLKLLLKEKEVKVKNRGGFLFRSVSNLIIDRHRTKKEMCLLDSVSNILNSTDSSPEEDAFKKEIWSTYSSAIRELPKEQREVFEKTVLNGETFEELSRKMNVSINTLLSRKHYAVMHLRKRLLPLYKEMTGKR